MTKKPRYPNTPTTLRGGEAWFYQTRAGLLVVAEERRGGKWIATAQCKIPWSKVCDAVDNHRKPRR